MIVITFSKEALTFWVGNNFASHSTKALQILALGVLFNALAQVPYGLIQSFGKPDLTAKLHLIELPFYLLLLWILTSHYGIVGAAIAWMIRSTMDMIGLFEIVRHYLFVKALYQKKRTILILFLFITMITGASIHNIYLKWFFISFFAGVYSYFIWYYFLGRIDKRILLDLIRNYRLFKR